MPSAAWPHCSNCGTASVLFCIRPKQAKPKSAALPVCWCDVGQGISMFFIQFSSKDDGVPLISQLLVSGAKTY